MDKWNVETLSFEDLRVRYWSGRDSTSGYGRFKVHTYHHYVVTNIGEFELDTWCELARQMIELHNEQTLQEQMLEWERAHNYTNQKEAMLVLESLSLHISRIFDLPLWVHYVLFNQKYRPEVLKKTPLAWVKTTCCKKPGLTTQAQVDEAMERGGDRALFCPFCGRRSAFEIVDAPAQESL